VIELNSVRCSNDQSFIDCLPVDLTREWQSNLARTFYCNWSPYQCTCF